MCSSFNGKPLCRCQMYGLLEGGRVLKGWPASPSWVFLSQNIRGGKETSGSKGDRRGVSKCGPGCWYHDPIPHTVMLSCHCANQSMSYLINAKHQARVSINFIVIGLTRLGFKLDAFHKGSLCSTVSASASSDLGKRTVCGKASMRVDDLVDC